MRRGTGIGRPGTRIIWASLALGSAFACKGDLVGPPRALLLQAVQPVAGAALSGAPGRPLPQPVTFRALDDADQPVAGAAVHWTVTGYGSRVDSAAAVTGADGSFQAVWVLGSRASEIQRLKVDVSLSGRATFAELQAAAVPVEVASIKVAPETTAVFLSAPRVLRAIATDPFGNRFVPTGVRFASPDTALITVDSLGTVQGRQGGFATVTATAGAVAGTGVVRVIQVVQSIGVDHDTLRFRSLRQIDSLKVWVVDDHGLPIRGLLPSVSLKDSSLVRVRAGAPFTVMALRTGSTTLQLQADSVVRQVALVVEQQPARIEATVTAPNPILTAAIGSLVPLQCRVFDANGYAIPIEATVSGSGSGVLAATASRCSDVRVGRSGLDTLRVSSGSAVAIVPVAVAVPPVVSPALGDYLQVDSLPYGEPWALSARRNSRGQLEVYFSLVDDRYTLYYENLHRLVSDDGIHFRYDGVVLQHDPDECSLTGFGFENVAIVPRQDGAGWRMYVSAGQFDCYGWQVLSAVSTDERNWVLEPGVRVRNGASLPPDESVAPQWPAGEGMVVDQLPSGGWRMIVGAYEHLDPAEDKFQIVEWDSPDQLNWTYSGPLLTTRQMPPAGQGTIYSPTIRQVAPGLWRMIFAGDNRFAEGWRGRLWSAVSTDLKQWQLEGQLIGSDASNLSYVSMVGDRVVFIRQDEGDVRRLAIATVAMP